MVILVWHSTMVIAVVILVMILGWYPDCTGIFIVMLIVSQWAIIAGVGISTSSIAITISSVTTTIPIVLPVASSHFLCGHCHYLFPHFLCCHCHCKSSNRNCF